MRQTCLARIFLIIVMSILAPVALAADGNPNMSADLTGVIEYRNTETNEWRGEDRFRMTVHPDGSKTMRVTNRLDNTLILRDVVTRVNRNYDPIDVYVSHWLDGSHRGTGFYFVKNNVLNVVTNSPNGTLQQSVDMPNEFSIATRPQATFGWHLGHYDFERGGVQPMTIYTVDRLGSSVGSILGIVRKFNIELVADKKLKVGAGVFDAWQFELSDFDDPSHRYEIWIEKENFLTLKLVHEELNRVYELVQLQETYAE